MKNSLRNLIVALIGQFVGIVTVFVTRRVFVSTLGSDYLGVDALFTNIVSLLSLVELGIGPSMSFALYKPLVENNQKKIRALMNVYKKAYCLIGTLILLLGVLLLPVYRFFITGDVSIPNLDIIFIFFVINCAASYFLSYKRTLIISNEKKYITTIVRYACYVAMNILQIILLLATKNYYLYLFLQLFFTILENIIISHIANKQFPSLKSKDPVPALEKKDKVLLKKNVIAMLFHKIGGMVVNSTDNILISKCVNTFYVGVNSNYTIITNALVTITNQFFEAVVASVGKIGARNNLLKLITIFNRAFFFDFILFGSISCVLAVVFNDFICLWVGEEYTFDLIVTLLIVINFYLKGIRKTSLMFRDALGLFWYDRYKPLAEAIINLLASILLAMCFGVSGIFIGTIISTVTTSLWVEPYVLFKYGFKRSAKDHFYSLLKYSLVTAIAMAVNFLLLSSFGFCGLLGIVLKGVVAFSIFMIISLLFFGRREEWRYYKRVMKNILRKIRIGIG